YSPSLTLGAAARAIGWRDGRRLEAAVTAAFARVVWLLSAAWLARFPTAFTGARYLCAAVPLLAAFAGPALERAGAGVRWTLGAASIGLTYLAVPAGHIPDPAPPVHPAKAFDSGP